MRELLERWAKLEPGKCQFTESSYLVLLNEEDWRYLARHDLTFWDLIWIQGVVQQAIVSRGWSYSLEYSRNTKKNSAIVVVPGIVKRGEAYNASNPAEALLSAYLKALEETR